MSAVDHDGGRMEGQSNARVVSVNVGRVRALEWHGRTVTTAIWRAPVTGRVHIRTTSLVGDEQADPRVHGGPEKAVYAYSIDDYRWWEREISAVLDPGTYRVPNLAATSATVSAA